MPQVASSVSSSKTTNSRTSPLDRAHHKALLTSTRALTQLNPLPTLNTPDLTPTTRDRLSPSTSTEFLSNLGRIRIVETHKSTRDGATLYVVEVFAFFQPNSNIPTMAQTQLPVSSVSRASGATPTTASTSEHEPSERQPELCVRRRFSDFSRLRRETVAVSCMNAHFLCQYCRAFQTYVRFHIAQPLWFVRIMTTKNQRKKILAQFLADLVDFAKSRAQRDRHCRLRQTLPKLIEAFLTD